MSFESDKKEGNQETRKSMLLKKILSNKLPRAFLAGLLVLNNPPKTEILTHMQIKIGQKKN